VTERFKATPLRVINEVGHAWGVRMGTRLQYHTCSHVNSPNLSVARGSHLLPLWLKYYCRSPEKTTVMPKLWISCRREWEQITSIPTRNIHIGENLRFTYTCNIYIYVGWNFKALHHMHHITTRCTSYINRYKDRCKERHMHAYIRPKHACTRACRHKGSPLSFIMLPLFLLLALQCTTSINTYKQTKMPA